MLFSKKNKEISLFRDHLKKNQMSDPNLSSITHKREGKGAFKYLNIMSGFVISKPELRQLHITWDF